MSFARERSALAGRKAGKTDVGGSSEGGGELMQHSP